MCIRDSGSTVTLNWGAVTDLPNPGGSGLSGYLIHRAYQFIKFVPGGTLTTTDVGVANGTHRLSLIHISEPTRPY